MLLEDTVSRGFTTLRVLLWVVGLCGVAVTLIALVQFAQVSRTTVLGLRAGKYAGLSFGPFVNSNHGAAFVNVTMPIIYFLLWRKAFKMNKLVNRFGLILLVIGLFLMQSCVLVGYSARAAAATLLLYPIVWAIRCGLKLRIPALATVALLLTALAALTIFAVRQGLVADSDRYYLNANIPAENWLLGNGLGSFEERFPAVWTDMPIIGSIRNTHLENEYLQLFFEGGIIPALASLVVAAVAGWLSFNLAKSSGTAFWLAPALAGETVHAAVDFTFHVFPIVGAYLLLWATSMKVVRHNGEV